jgi:mannose-6-phosphate isomerase
MRGIAQLAPSFREKIWGSTRLEPWFPDSSRNVGEVWFEADPPLPILVKLLFTSDRLSVQVHPADDYAARHEHSRGKTEMWHILRAEPGAAVAAGLMRTLGREELIDAAHSGEIEQLLNWIPVAAGDTIFIPAGTIHAIGGGIALCEIQQHSDVTYRLYDYGRPRELHLEKAADVAVRGPYLPVTPPQGLLACCPYFATEELHIEAASEQRPDPRRFELLIALEGEGRLAGCDFRCGQVWHVDAGVEPFTIEPHSPARLLRTYVP